MKSVAACCSVLQCVAVSWTLDVHIRSPCGRDWLSMISYMSGGL